MLEDLEATFTGLVGLAATVVITTGVTTDLVTNEQALLEHEVMVTTVVDKEVTVTGFCG